MALKCIQKESFWPWFLTTYLNYCERFIIIFFYLRSNQKLIIAVKFLRFMYLYPSTIFFSDRLYIKLICLYVTDQNFSTFHSSLVSRIVFQHCKHFSTDFASLLPICVPSSILSQIYSISLTVNFAALGNRLWGCF